MGMSLATESSNQKIVDHADDAAVTAIGREVAGTAASSIRETNLV
jgi:hypothetical protein